jgi:hypothetical protein
MSYRGVVIAESLEDPSVLRDLVIVETKVEPVTDAHRTPWVAQWTLHTVEVSDDSAEAVAEKLSTAIDGTRQGHWYADFKDDRTHYVVYRNRIFRVDRRDVRNYDEPRRHGLALGIPEYQLDFSPDIP